jgi:hypothetical protein
MMAFPFLRTPHFTYSNEEGESLMSRFMRLALSVSLLSVLASPAFALDEAKAKALIHDKIGAWLNNPVVINAIKAQNEKNAALTEEQIKDLDKKWAEGDAAVIDPVLNNDLSKYLKDVVAKGDGLYTEIFITDNKGLNVGQSDKTSDFWQGDEPKWQNTYPKGADAVEIGKVELDESTQTYQVQLSTTVSDAGAPIGAVTIGLNADKVE